MGAYQWVARHGIAAADSEAMSVYNAATAGISVAAAFLGTSFSLYAPPATPTITVDAATISAFGRLTGSVLAGANVSNAVLSCKGTLTGSVQVAITPSATLVAQGNLAGTIVPYTALSPESLALFLQQNLKPRLDTIEQKVAK